MNRPLTLLLFGLLTLNLASLQSCLYGRKS